MVESICTLFRELGTTIFSILTAISMTISAIVLAITGAFGGGVEDPPPEDERDLNKWLNSLADALKGLAGKAVEALSATVESVVGIILGFLGNAVGLAAEHTWVLIVFIVGHVGVWLMQKVKKG